MDLYDEKSQTFLANKRAFTDFLTNEVDGVYQRRIAAMLRNQETRLIVSLDDMRKFDPDLARRVLESPMEMLAPFQSTLKEYVLSLSSSDTAGVDGESLPRAKSSTNYTVGIDGNFGGQRVSPRQLQAQHLGRLVCVEGIATRCSIVRPKVHKTVHYCAKTNVHSEMSYHDSTSMSGFPTSSIYPTKDLEGNPLTTEFGLSSYQDHQTLVIQEMPERAPAGLLPSSVDVVLDDDLVDQCKPGDRVAIIGVYRALPSKSQGQTSGIFKSVLIANHVKHLGKSVGTRSQITPGDIANIRKIARKPDVFALLGRSVAPSIFGHEFIKRALVLLLLGGVEKNLDNGTHIRGDINMLFVGDPSTAKSQLLRFILNIAPLALNTTGRGSSGVGLTAAVTQDKETGERRLEAGAMVLADRGVVCIDEFDKMSDADRVAIHEVMEQQTVTIAKAGIHMSLNARCSVVAAANPRYSQYDSTKPPNWNVNLPDSLLSRFDFLFIILDTPDAEHDRAIADKVLSNHRYIRRSKDEEEEEEEVDYNAAAQREGGSEPADTEPYQKFDKLLHAGLLRAAGARGRVGGRKAGLEILSIPFMKKYIEYAKSIEPILSDEAADFIGRAYAELRNKAMESAARESSFPITARTLETLIRLSTAHAKARLDSEVRVEDCEQVLQILKYAIEHDTGVKAKEKPIDRAQVQLDEDSEDEEEEKEEKESDVDMSASTRSPRRRGRRGAGEDEEGESVRASPSKAKRKSTAVTTLRQTKKSRTAPGSGRSTRGSEEMETGEEKEESSAPSAPTPSAPVASAAPAGATEARLVDFRTHLVRQMKELRVESITIRQVLTALNERADHSPYEQDEAETILAQMERNNLVMYRNGTIYKI